MAQPIELPPDINAQFRKRFGRLPKDTTSPHTPPRHPAANSGKRIAELMLRAEQQKLRVDEFQAFLERRKANPLVDQAETRRAETLLREEQAKLEQIRVELASTPTPRTTLPAYEEAMKNRNVAEEYQQIDRDLKTAGLSDEKNTPSPTLQTKVKNPGKLQKAGRVLDKSASSFSAKIPGGTVGTIFLLVVIIAFLYMAVRPVQTASGQSLTRLQLFGKALSGQAQLN